MNDNDKRILREQDRDPIVDPENECVVSTTECTGLVQTPPASNEEAEALAKIVDIPLPKGKKDTASQ